MSIIKHGSGEILPEPEDEREELPEAPAPDDEEK
jgi:hypothetical protein